MTFIETSRILYIFIYNSLPSNPKQINLEALVSPMSPCVCRRVRVCFAYFLFLFDWLPKVTHILWSTKSGMIRVPCSVIFLYQRQMGFSFPSCSLIMLKLRFFLTLSRFFPLLFFRNFSHYLTCMVI